MSCSATLAADPKEQPSVRSPDLGDDYLIALEDEGAAFVSGDDHRLRLEEDVPIFPLSRFLRLLEAERHTREP